MYIKVQILKKSVEIAPHPRINITIDFTSVIRTFQDLRYIGELRQRWEEIKKLQIKPVYT